MLSDTVQIVQNGITPSAQPYTTGPLASGAGLGVTLFDQNGVPIVFSNVAPQTGPSTGAAVTGTAWNQIAALNTARKKFFLKNPTNKVAYFSYASITGASTGVYAFSLAASGSYESALGDYQGPIFAIAPGVSSGNSILVTELT